MSYKGFQESRPRFSNSLTGQRWIFLKKGLDDFRNGFPPSPDNMLVNGRKQPVSITLESSTPKSLSRAPRKKRNQCRRAQVCLSKLSLLQQARKDYVAHIECCLSQHPSVCYPCLEKSTSPKILKEVAGVLDPDMILKSKAGYSDYEQENQPDQEVLGHMEDMQSKVTASKTQVHGKESRVKTPCAQLPKKVAARIKEATLADFVPYDEHVKRATKHFCDWVMSLGGGNWNIDEDTLMSLLNTSYEREATAPSLFNAVKFISMETKQFKSHDISPPQLAVRSSHYLRSLPCQVEVPSQTKWEKIRYGAWYLDPKTWGKQKANEPLKAPEATINSLMSVKNWSENVL